jgi:uncharacterized protein (TIGR03435 family)
MKRKPQLALLALVLPVALAQQPATPTPPVPAFEVAAIKPVDPNKGGVSGFLCYPGGRVFIGNANIKMLLEYAYDTKGFQISGETGWADTERYNIEALPPESSPSRNLKQAPFGIAPTAEQKQMLQSLLRDRYALKLHTETRQGEVYLLTRSSKPLQLVPPKYPDLDSRGGVMMKQGGIADGEATGSNVTMAFLASQLSSYLGLPVLDQTGIAGSWDYHLPPTDPENRDFQAAVLDAMRRLGLDLKKSKAPIETIVIDHLERPAPN